MELNTHTDGKPAGKLQVAETVFNCEFKEPLIHQVVTAILAGERQGTKAQKTRAEVRGGGIKPWRQKGTGRARAGSIRSPIWRSGGVTFAAKPRSFKEKVNKKMYRAAMRSILSELYRQGRLMVTENLTLPTNKTKDMVALLKQWDLDKVLIVTEALDENLYFAARNIPHVHVCDASALDPVTLIGSEKIILTTAALRQIEEHLA